MLSPAKEATVDIVNTSDLSEPIAALEPEDIAIDDIPQPIDPEEQRRQTIQTLRARAAAIRAAVVHESGEPKTTADIPGVVLIDDIPAVLCRIDEDIYLHMSRELDERRGFGVIYATKGISEQDLTDGVQAAAQRGLLLGGHEKRGIAHYLRVPMSDEQVRFIGYANAKERVPHEVLDAISQLCEAWEMPEPVAHEIPAAPSRRDVVVTRLKAELQTRLSAEELQRVLPKIAKSVLKEMLDQRFR